MAFTTQILAGLALGTLTGLFLGEKAAAFKWAADGFVKLLQMMVLPYITVSIVGSLGSLRRSELRTLGVKAALVIGGLWVVALSFALLIPLTFPSVQNASFFSSSLLDQPPRLRLHRPLHSGESVQCPREQHRAGGRPLLALPGHRAGWRRTPGAAARHPQDRERRDCGGDPRRDPPDAVWTVCDRRQRGRDPGPGAVEPSADLPDRLRRGGPPGESLGASRTGRRPHPDSRQGHARRSRATRSSPPASPATSSSCFRA